MKKQKFAILKTDWCVVHKSGKKELYHYATKLKGAKAWAAKQGPGTVQIFKLSYEFKNIIEQ